MDPTYKTYCHEPSMTLSGSRRGGIGICGGSLPLKKRRIFLGSNDLAARPSRWTSSILPLFDSTDSSMDARGRFVVCGPSPSISISSDSNEKMAGLALVASRAAAVMDRPDRVESRRAVPISKREAPPSSPRSQSGRVRITHPPLTVPLPNGCHGRTSRNNSYCRRVPRYNKSVYCKLHHQQYVRATTTTRDDTAVAIPENAGNDQVSFVGSDEDTPESPIAKREGPSSSSAPPSEAGTPLSKHAYQDKKFQNLPGEVPCSATTTRGRRCGFSSADGTAYCHLHASSSSKRRGSNQGGGGVDGSRMPRLPDLTDEEDISPSGVDDVPSGGDIRSRAMTAVCPSPYTRNTNDSVDEDKEAHPLDKIIRPSAHNDSHSTNINVKSLPSTAMPTALLSDTKKDNLRDERIQESDKDGEIGHEEEGINKEETDISATADSTCSPQKDSRVVPQRTNDGRFTKINVDVPGPKEPRESNAGPVSSNDKGRHETPKRARSVPASPMTPKSRSTAAPSHPASASSLGEILASFENNKNSASLCSQFLLTKIQSDLLFGTAALERSRRVVKKPIWYEDTAMIERKKRSGSGGSAATTQGETGDESRATVTPSPKKHAGKSHVTPLSPVPGRKNDDAAKDDTNCIHDSPRWTEHKLKLLTGVDSATWIRRSVRVLTGPMKGRTGEVTAIVNGWVHVSLPGIGSWEEGACTEASRRASDLEVLDGDSVHDDDNVKSSTMIGDDSPSGVGSSTL